MSLDPGIRLGSYEVLSALGAGGMGEVYRARDTKLGREVAIKVLPEGFAEEEERLARFEREPKTISQLSHPHICALDDVGHPRQMTLIKAMLSISEEIFGAPCDSAQIIEHAKVTDLEI